jgi:serine protease SohB
MFGENTEKGRQKFLEELEDVHTLFKDFISEHRPQVNMTEVATGEAWYGRRALTHQLVDELKTSDEYIVDKCLANDVFQVKYIEDRSRVDQVMERFSALLTRVKSAELLRTNEPFRF